MRVVADTGGIVSAINDAESRDVEFRIEDVTDGFYELVNPSRDDLATASELVRRYWRTMQRKRRGDGDLLRDPQPDAPLDRSVVPLSGHPAFALVPDDLPG